MFVTVMLKVMAEVLVFDAASENDPDAMVMTAVPPVDGEAVNVAVYDVPDPENPVSAPRVEETSDAANVVVDSLAVKVTVDVEPDVTELGLELIVIVGDNVS